MDAFKKSLKYTAFAVTLVGFWLACGFLTHIVTMWVAVTTGIHFGLVTCAFFSLLLFLLIHFRKPYAAVMDRICEYIFVEKKEEDGEDA